MLPFYMAWFLYLIVFLFWFILFSWQWLPLWIEPWNNPTVWLDKFRPLYFFKVLHLRLFSFPHHGTLSERLMSLHGLLNRRAPWRDGTRKHKHIYSLYQEYIEELIIRFRKISFIVHAQNQESVCTF